MLRSPLAEAMRLVSTHPCEKIRFLRLLLSNQNPSNQTSSCCQLLLPSQRDIKRLVCSLSSRNLPAFKYKHPRFSRSLRAFYPNSRGSCSPANRPQDILDRFRQCHQCRLEWGWDYHRRIAVPSRLAHNPQAVQDSGDLLIPLRQAYQISMPCSSV